MSKHHQQQSYANQQGSLARSGSGQSEPRAPACPSDMTAAYFTERELGQIRVALRDSDNELVLRFLNAALSRATASAPDPGRDGR